MVRIGSGTGGHGKAFLFEMAGSQPRPMEMSTAGGGSPGRMGIGDVDRILTQSGAKPSPRATSSSKRNLAKCVRSAVDWRVR